MNFKGYERLSIISESLEVLSKAVKDLAVVWEEDLQEAEATGYNRGYEEAEVMFFEEK